MKPRVQCLLRRCADPLCGILFHPARLSSIYCRTCAALHTHSKKKEGKDERRPSL